MELERDKLLKMMELARADIEVCHLLQSAK